LTTHKFDVRDDVRLFYFSSSQKPIHMIRCLAAISCLLLSICAVAQHVPTFEETISLRGVGGVRISPDGKHVVFGVNSTDWTENRYDTEYWLSKNGDAPFQLTNTPKGSSGNVQFSPDSKWIAFLAIRGSKNQIHAMRVDGGEARAVTNDEEGITSFEWHPSGAKFIFQKPEKEDKTKKDREKRYGGFEADDKEFTVQHLWQIDFTPDMRDPSEMPCYEASDSLKVKAGCIEWPKATRITEGKFTVTGYATSPDGTRIAITHQPDPLINTSVKSDISIVDIATKKITSAVANPSSDFFQEWSPNSQEILYTTKLSDTTSHFYSNSKVFSINLSTKAARQLAKTLDEDLGGFVWTPMGIFTAVQMKTNRPMYRIDPSTGTHTLFLQKPDQIFGYSFSKAGDRFANQRTQSAEADFHDRSDEGLESCNERGNKLEEQGWGLD
jgi:dipeptidyl aminopeptidase/acylaminoacyl peptidase